MVVGSAHPRARRALVEAMTAVLDSDRPLTEVTITDLVARAGVSRPTFYAHFEDIPALVRETALLRLAVTFDRIPAAALGESWHAFARGTFTVLLTDLVRDARFYLTAWESAETLLTADFVRFLSDRLLHHSPLGPIIRRRPGADTPQQRSEFLAAGTIWNVRSWLLSGEASERTVDSFVHQLAALLLSASGATDAEIAETGIGAPPGNAPQHASASTGQHHASS